jgi:hypothetical protein
MKRFLIMTALLLLILYSGAQEKASPASSTTAAGLTEGARLLFGSSPSKLTPAQKNLLYKKLGLQLADDRKGFRMDGFAVGAKAYSLDLNKDGVEEVFVIMHGLLFGNTGQGVALFTKSNQQPYEHQAEVAGGIAVILDTQTNGYPDLVIAGPGFEFPLYKWNGKSYVYTRNISDDQLQSAATHTVEEYAKLYQKGKR